MNYEMEPGAVLMREWDLATISLVQQETISRFHSETLSLLAEFTRIPQLGQPPPRLSPILQSAVIRPMKSRFTKATTWEPLVCFMRERQPKSVAALKFAVLCG